jgi:hypothetical protein
MRRSTALKTAVAGCALATLAIGGAAAFADTDDPESSVVNKNGHEVDEHAADGQARAALARAQRLEKAEEAPSEDKTDNGNHGGPDEHAGDHPNPKAFENPQAHEPRGPRDGLGPNDHASDHPNVNATDGPRGPGGK